MSINAINYKHSCIKTLSAVEAELIRSNQHELNGVTQLKTLFGEDRVQMAATFSVRGSAQIYNSQLTWYDARESHATRSEYRLYFKSNPVMSNATEGDNIIIGFDQNQNIHCELIPQQDPGYQKMTGWNIS